MRIKLYKQKKKLSCGPAALKMVLSNFGKDISEDDIIIGVGGLKRYGVRSIKLTDFARQLGFKVVCYSFNKKLANKKAIIKRPLISDVKNFIREDIPVILSVNSKILYNNFRQDISGHFIVITKYRNRTFWYNDPKDGKRHSIKEDDLILAWYNNVLDSSAYLLVIKEIYAGKKYKKRFSNF